MKTFKRLFALLVMLFCCSAMFANYYYCSVLVGAKVIEVGNPKYTPDNGQPQYIKRTVADRGYLSLTPYTVTDDINNVRLYKADSEAEVLSLVKDESDYFYSLLSEEEKNSLEFAGGSIMHPYFPETIIVVEYEMAVVEYEMAVVEYYEKKDVYEIYPELITSSGIKKKPTKKQKDEVKRINAELKAKTFAYIDNNRNKTQNIDNAKKFVGTSKTESDSIEWSPMFPLDFVGNAKNYHYEIINTSKETYWEHEEYLNCTYLIKFKDNDRYMNDRGRFTKKESAKIFETYADVYNAFKNCDIKSECEIVRNL